MDDASLPVSFSPCGRRPPNEMPLVEDDIAGRVARSLVAGPARR
jgi:hypothetical protein